jgi:hypothetical protein
MRCLRFLVISLFLIVSAACNRSPTKPVEEVSLRAKAQVIAEEDLAQPPINPPAPPSNEATVRLASGTPPSQAARAWSPPPFPHQLPPSPSPFGWSGVVVRLEFNDPARRGYIWATGFVVRDRARADWLFTCAHGLGEKAWQDRYQVTMRTMKGDRIIRSFGTTLHVGLPFDVHDHSWHGWPDMTHDLVIRLVAGEWVQPMRLAQADPQVGDWVWAVGCEAHQPLSDEKLFLCQVVKVGGGAFILKKQVAFRPGGFSGGPVINARGEVVGNLLGCHGDLVSGATVSTLRRRLKAKGISVD